MTFEPSRWELRCTYTQAYYWATNYHKFGTLRQHTLINGFEGQESWHVLAGSSASVSHKVWVGAAVSSPGSTGKDPLPSSSGGRTQFLVAVGWRLPSVPCHVDSSGGQLTTQQLTSPKPARESVPQQDRLIILCNTIQKWHPAIFALYSII